ncbi:MAG: CPBP family intramembrane metalloprotease [Clostridia bacterium]|nr:CPBP family intramembrane metalloprotease [Clostridia bacterium]
MTEEMKERFKSPLITTPLLVIFVLIAMQASKYALRTLQSDTNVFIAVGVVQLATLALPCMVYYLLKGRKLQEPIYLVPRGGTHILFLIFAALFFICGMLIIKFFYFVNGGSVASLVNFYEDFSGTTEGSSQVEIILSLIVIPAFCEELFFRGIVFSEYRKYGTANAIIMSALCFSMLHFSIENIFIYLFTGLLLGFVTAITRSIIPSIALHLLSNTLSIYASDAFLRVTVVKNGAFFIGFVLTILTGVAFVLMLTRVESICYAYAEKPPIELMPPKSSSNFFKVFFSPTFIFLVLAFVAVSLLT